MNLWIRYGILEFFILLEKLFAVKFFSWLICLIIIVVSFTPCKDFANAKVSEQTSVSKAGHADDHNSLANDDCSPFCVCCCCSTPTVVTQTLLTSTVSLIIDKEYSDIAPGHIASNDPSVWQPPKLG